MAGELLPFYPSDGDTRLHVSAYEGRVLELIELLNRELDYELVNRSVSPLGATPLRLAATRGWTLCCLTLLHYGAEVDKVDRKGQTPLFCAVKNQCWKIVRLLLNHGASPNGSRLNRLTPLQSLLTKSESNESMYATFMTLLKGGADVDVEKKAYQPQRCTLCSILILDNPSQFLSTYYEFGGCLRQCGCYRKTVGKRLENKENTQEILSVIGMPLHLQSLCRIAVRKQFEWNRLEQVKRLPLPAFIISFLMYEEFPF